MLYLLKIVQRRAVMTFTISQLAKEFNITTRTIRYYEELELLIPQRSSSGRRQYSKKDRGKLKLIIRGKRLDFSLQEIKEMVQLFDTDPHDKELIEKSLQFGQNKLNEIEEKMNNLEQLKVELLNFQQQFSEHLKK